MHDLSSADWQRQPPRMGLLATHQGLPCKGEPDIERQCLFQRLPTYFAACQQLQRQPLNLKPSNLIEQDLLDISIKLAVLELASIAYLKRNLTDSSDSSAC